MGRANETLSVGFGRPLDKLLFTGVEPRIGFGGLELENLRVAIGGILTTSSSDEEVDSLSSSSVLLRCVVKWIGCGATFGRVYEETDWMRGLDVGTGLDLAALKPSFHLKSLTKFSMFLCGCSGIIGTGAGFLTSVGMPGGCQIANRWVSTIVGVGGMEGGGGRGGGSISVKGGGNDERGYRRQRSRDR